MAEQACLPLIFPYLVDLRQSGDTSHKLVAAFEFVGFFGRKEPECRPNGVVEGRADREGISESWYMIFFGRSCCLTFVLVASRSPPGHTVVLPPSCPRNLQQLHPQASLGIRNKQDLYSKPLSADEFHIAFQEQYADEIWALKAKIHYQIFKEAHLQMMIVFRGMAHASVIALEILSGLERTQMALLSSAIEITGRTPHSCLNSRAWTKGQKADFVGKYTRYVPGSWDTGDVLDQWEELVKVSKRKNNTWQS